MLLLFLFIASVLATNYTLLEQRINVPIDQYYQLSNQAFSYFQYIPSYNFIGETQPNITIEEIMDFSNMSLSLINFGESLLPKEIPTVMIVLIFIFTLIIWLCIQCCKCACCKDQNQCCSSCFVSNNTKKPACINTCKGFFITLAICLAFIIYTCVHNEILSYDYITNNLNNFNNTLNKANDLVSTYFSISNSSLLETNNFMVMTKNTLQYIKVINDTDEFDDDISLLDNVASWTMLFDNNLTSIYQQINDVMEPITENVNIYGNMIKPYLPYKFVIFEFPIVICLICVILVLINLCIKNRCCLTCSMTFLMIFELIIGIFAFVMFNVSLIGENANELIYDPHTYDVIQNYLGGYSGIIGHYISCQDGDPLVNTYSNIFDYINTTIDSIDLTYLQNNYPAEYNGIMNNLGLLRTNLTNYNETLLTTFNCFTIFDTIFGLIDGVFIDDLNMLKSYTVSYFISGILIGIMIYVLMTGRYYWTNDFNNSLEKPQPTMMQTQNDPILNQTVYPPQILSYVPTQEFYQHQHL